MRILLVCTGNTCRSSMAEVLLKALLAKEGLAGVEVVSAGIAARTGQPAARQALAVMAEQGIDLAEHRSQSLTPQLLEADLILTMTSSHRDNLLRYDPTILGRIFTLKEYVDPQANQLNILDPFGGSVEVYRQTAQELEELLNLAILKMRKTK